MRQRPDDNRYSFPHIVVTESLAGSSQDRWAEQSLLLYAGHLLARLVLMLKEGAKVGSALQLSAIKDAFVGEGGGGTDATEGNTFFRDPERVRQGLETIESCLGLFLEQFMHSGLSAQTLLSETLEGLGQVGRGLNWIRVFCVHPERPDRVWDWSGRSEPLVLYENYPSDVPATVYMTGEGEGGGSKVFAHFCTRDFPIKPLVPFPNASGIELFENPRGLIFEGDGKRHPFSKPLSSACALARLLLFYGTPLDDVITLANETKVYGLGVEALLATLRERISVDGVEKLLRFVEEHGEQEDIRDLMPSLKQFLESEEQKLREGGDYTGLAEVLVVKQRIETGSAKIISLQKAANVFRERLGDNEAAYLCLTTALDNMAAYDEALIDDLVDVARQANKEDEVVERILKVAETTRDAEVAVRAATLAKAEKAKLAWRLAVRAENTTVRILEDALAFAKESGDLELMKEACEKMRRIALDKEKKLNATVTLAAIMSSDDPFGAARLLEEVIQIDPQNLDALDALLDIYLKAGKPEESRRVLELVLERTIDPQVRAHCLKRLTTLLLDVFKERENAIGHLEEYVTFHPEDSAAVQLLEGLYEQAGLWDKYLVLLAKKASKDKENAVHYYLAMADCAKTRLGDQEMSSAFLSYAFELDPKDHILRLRMRDLLEKKGFYAQVVRLLEDEVKDAEGDKVCDLYLKMAEIYDTRLKQRDKAKEVLAKAFSTAGSANIITIATKLAALYEEDGEEHEAKKVWEKTLAYALEDEQKVFVLKNLAKLSSPILGAKKQFLEAILAVNPLEKESALELARVYLHLGEYEKSIALLDPLLERFRDDKPFFSEALEISAKCASALKISDLALARLRTLAELRPGDTALELLLLKALKDASRDDEVVSVSEELLKKEISPEQKLEVLRLAYQASLATQKDEKALEYMEAIVALEGKKDFNTVMELVNLAEKAQEKGRLVRYLTEALALASGPEARFAIKMKLGDLYRESGEHQQALRWFMDALNEGVSVKIALFRALQEAEEVQDLETRANLLRRLIDAEIDCQKRARLKYPLAMHEMRKGRKDKAKELLWSAIKDDIGFEEARMALENIMIADYDSDGLRELYEALLMQAKASGNKDRVLTLLQKLLDIYDKTMKNPERAMDVLRELLELKGDDKDLLLRLANVAGETLGNERVMLDAHRRVLEIDPTHEASYKAIRNIFRALRDDEGLWCASGALLALGLGDQEDKMVYEKGREPALKLKRDSLPKADFDKLIRHKDANIEVATVFHILYQALLKLLSLKKPADLGLGEEDVIVPRGKNLLENMALAVSKILGVPLPKLYRAKGRLGITKLPFNPPALAIGDDCVESWRGKEVRFAMGRALVSFMPGFEMSGIVADAATLKPFFLAAIKVVMPDFAVAQDVSGVSELAGELRGLLDEESKIRLKKTIDAFRQSKRPIDISAFLEGIDKTACRTGFFLSNDILVSAQMLQMDQLFLSDLEFGDRLLDMCAYSLSERYFELRKLMLKAK